jgi:isoaspartyl peptidase/L-asparaginase-like protein (Ntn-hydrolase superfamily)
MKKIKIVWYWNSRLRCFDQNGKIAAATSTGGKGFEVPGRISDSATVAGNYANPLWC